MNKKNIFFAMFIILINISCSKDSSNDNENTPPNTVTGIKISPMLVGNNVWYKNPTNQVWDLTAACGVKSMRIGGNNYNGTMPTKAELLDWVKRIQTMGAEPIFQVSQLGSPATAADYVKYFNVDLASGKAIKYWNIGNEPWLKLNQPATSTMGASVEAYFKPIAAAMKEVDPTIKIYGPDECYYMEDEMNDLFGGKNNIAGKVPGKNYYYCDGLSWHRYPQDASIDLAYQGIEDFKASIVKCKTKIDAVNKQLGRTGDDALGWALGEYNAKDGTLVHSWKNGQMFGGVLDLCMKYGATYATTWSMFENGGSRAGTDFSFIDGANMTPRPSYRHMQMIAKNFKGIYAGGKSSKYDFITFGSVDGSTISVMIMNRSNTATTFTLHLNKTATTANGNVQLNIDANSPIVYTGAIEGLATHTYVFKNNEIIRTVYTNQHFINEQAPVESKL
ncbi:hypothetical protein [Flavobacterium flavipallidum]|uniref:Alpha-L-arabinofuranosidase n=1 Tax=Flavobacterium flavipallidum TaxID=3139140 RepID=A0ABU9HKW2_9FLAO